MSLFLSDSQVEPLIQVFGLYLTHEAGLADMREPTMIATRAMRSIAMPSEAILGTLESAVHIAATAREVDPLSERVVALRECIGPWLLDACFDTRDSMGDAPLAS